MRRAAVILGLASGLVIHAGVAGVVPDNFRLSVATIDFFGLRKVSEAEVRSHLPFKEGDELSDKQHRADGDAVAKALGVDKVTLAYICCTPDQKAMVYVGVAEKPARRVRTPPMFAGAARLPEEMMRADAEFGPILLEAVKAHTNEDHSQGHALSEYPPLRAVQDEFVGYARDNFALLSEVLATSADEHHRAVAAMILGYTPDKRAAAGVLAQGVRDPSDLVRNNSTRGLGVIAEYSGAHPELGIHIDPEPFVAMLNSVVWSDLNKGLMVLTQLTANREPGLIKLLRKRARPTLIDICRWKNPGHSFQGCLVLRRLEGLPDFSERDARAEVLQKVGADGPAPP